MKIGFTWVLLALALNAYSQTDSAQSPVKITGYCEVYYCYDFSDPSNHIRPNFIYSFNRHNEINMNLGFIQAVYEKNGIRSNFGLMAGTYAQYNLSAEHPIFQHLMEGTIGIKLSNKRAVWIDVGVMPSHIGFESAIGKTCWNLTRSILADNSPYYESGVKLGYTSSDAKWYLAGLYLNGWQHIQRLSNNQTPAFGTQLTFKPNSTTVLNWSAFVGNEFPDSVQRWRYFNNFYCQIRLHKKIGIIAGFDIGFQQKFKNSDLYNSWYSPVLIFRYSPTDKLFVVARGEYYFDENQVIISVDSTSGFQTYGYSLNLDYAIRDNIMWRIEGRMFISKDPIFPEKGHFTSQNYFTTTSLAFSF